MTLLSTAKEANFGGNAIICSSSRCATDAYQRQAFRGPLKNEKNKNGLLDIAAQRLSSWNICITMWIKIYLVI